MPREGRTGTGTWRRRRAAGAVFVAAALVWGAAWVAPSVRGAVLTCGATVTASVRLTADVGPCAAGGLRVQGQNITVDLNGHRVFGTSAAADGVGILVLAGSDVTIVHGTVSNFDAGVVVSGGSGNRIERINAIANVGESGVTSFGDGIVITASSSNVVTGNEVRSNGPFSGISVIGQSSANKISRNTVQNNDIPAGDEQNDVGIRLEAGSSLTTLKENVVSFSGLDGIVIFQNALRNVLEGNTVKANGFHNKPHRKGDGIRIFGIAGPDENTLRRNVASDNAAHGIVLSDGATANILRRNKASRNGIAEPGAVDAADLNPGCDANTWVRNVFGSRNQGCVA
jgi:parallel beta-helix repeat protein